MRARVSGGVSTHNRVMDDGFIARMLKFIWERKIGLLK
jgi:hypothetical protein